MSDDTKSEIHEIKIEAPVAESVDASHSLIFQLAQQKDEARIAAFLAESEFHGLIDLRIARPKNILSVYAALADEYQTYFLESDSGEIVSTLTVLFRKGFVRRSPQRLAWLTDLRILPQKSALKSVSLQLLSLLEKIRDEKKVEQFFMVLSEAQETALQTFIRPRSTRANLPRFYLVRNFHAVCLHGKIPELRKDSIGVRISAGKTSDWDDLFNYLNSKSQAQLMGRMHSLASLNREFGLEGGARPGDFIVARDYSGNIVGCCALRNGTLIHEIQIEGYHGFSQTLKTAFNWLAITGIVQRLPKNNRVAQLSYLTHFVVDNPDIFMSMLRYIYKQRKKGEMPLYLNFEDDPTTLPTYPLITTQFPFSLYSLVLPGETTPMFLRTSPLEPSPDLDPSMI